MSIINKKLLVIQKNAIPVLERNDVEFAGVFGSYARSQAKKNSDLDILVKFKKSKSLFGIVRVESELSDVLNIKVDLVTERALCPHIKDRVMRDLRPIYG